MVEQIEEVKSQRDPVVVVVVEVYTVWVVSAMFLMRKVMKVKTLCLAMDVGLEIVKEKWLLSLFLSEQ